MVRRMVEYFYTGDYEDCSRSEQAPTEKKPENNGSSSEEDGLTPLRLHAKMFALADMYQVDHLQSLAVSKYGKELGWGAKIQDILDSIPDVYQLTPSSVRALRDRAVVALRAELGKPTRLRFERSGDQGDKTTADTLLEAYDEIAAESPEFLKDLLSSYIRAPLLGRCSHCAGEQPQPAEPLQIKCLTCGKGGARLLQ
ncbi:BTB domain-containing protein [Madurella fahalii]|uniref:BTB domain-containing protein n=1 Tax=Madurella fahalii TaxID=1157608 RepID=A0ABQ0GTE9_9PEZI